MSPASSKQPVRIVCPHCRRSYVIKADLARIYRTKPRAICSRCGGRFEVVQRMYEIEDDLVPTPSEDLGAPATTRPRSSRAVAPRKEQPLDDEGPPPTPPNPLPLQEMMPEPGDGPTTPVVVSQARAPISPRQIPRDLEKPRPPSPPPEPQRPTPRPQPAPDDDERPSLPSLELWDDLPPLSEADEVRLPTIQDLQDPMPWITSAPTTLSAISFQMPESAAALEWLLTERPSRPQGASPPPLPSDALSHAQGRTPSSQPPDEDSGRGA